MLEVIEKYFPNLTDIQREQLSLLPGLYKDWNCKINVISRHDIDNVMEHHILHSLAIAKVIQFTPGSKILDVGTGGGFPGIPLAILFPQINFHLIDSIGKKILVASDISKKIRLENIRLTHRNVIEEKEKYDFIVTRAVMEAAELIKLTNKNISSISRNPLKNGIIALKGGNLSQELAECKNIRIPHNSKSKGYSSENIHKWEIRKFFNEEYFEEKYVIHIGI